MQNQNAQPFSEGSHLMNCFKPMLSASMLFATLLAGSSTFASTLTTNTSNTTQAVNNQPDSSLISQNTATTKACQYVSYGVAEKDYNKVYNQFKSKKNVVPYWIDAYDYQGKLYYNLIFHCNNNYPYYAASNLTGSQYTQAYQKYKAQGYRQTYFDSYWKNGKAYYVVIFVKSPGPSWAAYYNQTIAQFQQTYTNLSKQGYRPVNISYIYYNNQLYVTSLYDKKPVGAYVHAYNLTYDQYQQKYAQYTNEGKKPAYVNAYKYNGQAYFSVIFNQEQYSAWKYTTKQDYNQFKNTYNSYVSQGYLTRYVAGYEYSGKNYFDGYWTK
jgi:hypothetical protein